MPNLENNVSVVISGPSATPFPFAAWAPTLTAHALAQYTVVAGNGDSSYTPPGRFNGYGNGANNRVISGAITSSLFGSITANVEDPNWTTPTPSLLVMDSQEGPSILWPTVPQHFDYLTIHHVGDTDNTQDITLQASDASIRYNNLLYLWTTPIVNWVVGQSYVVTFYTTITSGLTISGAGFALDSGNVSATYPIVATGTASSQDIGGQTLLAVGSVQFDGSGILSAAYNYQNCFIVVMAGEVPQAYFDSLVVTGFGGATQDANNTVKSANAIFNPPLASTGAAIPGITVWLWVPIPNEANTDLVFATGFPNSGEAVTLEFLTRVVVPVTPLVLWPFMPNWSSPVKETLEWMTNVMKSYDGNEQRVSLRPVARRKLSYDFLLLRTLTQFFENLLWGWQNMSFAVPLWPYVCKTTNTMTAGSLNIPMDTSTYGWVVGQAICLYLDPLTFDTLQIEAVNADSIDVATPTIHTWPVGSAVYPLGMARLESNVPVSRHSSHALNGTCNFVFSPRSVDPFVPEVAAVDLYNGVEVIFAQPDWSSPIDTAASFGFDTIDMQTGTIDYAATDTYQSLVFKFRWVLTSRADINAFRAFLGRLKGQLNTVYIPTWSEDFTLTQNIAATDTSISVVDRDFLTYVGVSPARNTLMIRTRTHGTFFRPIASVTSASPVALIQIGNSLGVAIPISDVVSISYMSLYRKSADNALIQWQTGEVAIIEDAFQLVAA